MESNPYAPPLAELSPQENPDAVRLREEHISTEATLKTVGFLYFAGALFAVLVGAGQLVLVSEQKGDLLWGLLLVILGVFQGWTGYGLRKLKQWAQIPTIILSILGLLAFPVGTLINAVILSRAIGKKAAFVFSDKYKEIIAATPHAKQKTSKIVWILLFLLLGILALVVVAAILSPAMSQ